MKLNYFNFKKFHDSVLMTNDFGKYLFVGKEDFKKIISKQIDEKSELAKALIEKKMIYEESDLEYSSKNKYLMREIKGHVNTATALHIFVVTTNCNMACVYCQANNGVENSHLLMDKKTAERAVDIALQSPEYSLSFEFQGGEPLLNFEVIRHIVEYAEENKGDHEISYNVVTNLTLLTDEILEFFKEHHFGLSTSLDGNELVHNANRKYVGGKGTFSSVLRSVDKIRQSGLHVGAIQTTTRFSLNYPKEIVRAYADLGFDSIFIRPLTPLGKASMYWEKIGYTPEEFLGFYKEAADELIQMNREGIWIKEDHASILLRRISGQFVNYMELRSPCGAGIGQMAYYADGNIFTCDEGRMLYEMGEGAFCLGNVHEREYKDLIENGICRTVCASSILETVPACCDCVYQPYCGKCPVVNYAMNGDVLEKQPGGYRCSVYAGILDYLFEKFYENEKETVNILNSWSN